MKLPRIIGIAGTNGSGKDTLGALLASRYGYKSVSLSDILRAELTRQGRPHTRENLSGLSRQIREAEGDGAMSRRVIETNDSDARLCITSVRTPGEVQEIQKAGGTMVWIDADEQIRYDRIQAAARGRGETDNISFEEFQRQQAVEMTPTAEGGGLNMAAVRDLADVVIENDYGTVEAYEQHLIDTFEL